MFLIRPSLAGLLAAAAIAASILVAPAAHAAKTHHTATSAKTHHARRVTHHYYRHRSRRRGQQEIQPERVTQIQEALIKAHYLDGEATGEWDAATKAAMQKYQADNGWQTKLMPDSRALVKLGLGHDYSDAINAKDLSLASPHEGDPIPADQEAGFEAASGVSQ